MIKEQVFIKKDTSDNWAKAKNFIPKKDEIIVYTDIEMKKIGDGITKLSDLPFIDNNKYWVEDSTLVIET